MEVSALKYSGGIGLHGRSTLLRLQSDERLVAYLRKGNTAAFEVLVARYQSRLHAFCRHLLGSREDAEDVLQEVLAAAFNAILADDRPINVRPWLYRIARNRSLNHLRRAQAVGVDSMDIHLSENGASTADKVHEREEFRLLVGDIHELPETQKTALVLREMDALSYEQIAEAMETTVSSVKSLLVRARVSLAEAAEARLLSCDEVRIELGEVAEGLRRRPSTLVRRHLRGCKRCSTFRTQLKDTNRALAALLPIGPLVLIRKFALLHLSHSAGAGSGATAAGSGAASGGAAGAGAAGSTAVVGTTVIAGSATSGFVSAGIGALATKAAAGLAAAVLVTAGAVEVGHSSHAHRHARHPVAIAAIAPARPARTIAPPANVVVATSVKPATGVLPKRRRDDTTRTTKAVKLPRATTTASKGPTAENSKSLPGKTAARQPVKATPPAGRTQTQSDPTVLPPGATTVTEPAPATPTAGAVATAPAATAGAAGATATGTPSGDPTLPTGTPVPASGTGTPTSTIGTPTGDGTGSFSSVSGTRGSGSTTPGSGSGSGPTGKGTSGSGSPSGGGGGSAGSGASSGATGPGASSGATGPGATPPIGPVGMPPEGPAGKPPIGPVDTPPNGLAGTPPDGPAGTPPNGPAGTPPNGPAGTPPDGRVGTPRNGRVGTPRNGRVGAPRNEVNSELRGERTQPER
jgi:RNA polymerase sigma factor (sigma-70 family)